MKKSKLKALAIRAMYEVYLHKFARLCFDALYPTKTLDEAFHIDVICKYLVDLLNAEGGGVVLNMPPRNLKSFIASMVFPLYAILRKPALGIIVLAGTQELATEFITNVTKILDSERYRSIFGDLTYERTGSTLRFSNSGTIQFAVYMHNIIGKGFDLCIIDDPQSPTVAKNAGLRKASNQYFDTSVATRMNRSGQGKIVIVQQRLHDNDLSGYLIEQNVSWTSVCIPAVAMRNEVWEMERGRHIRKKFEVICEARENFEQYRGRLWAMGGVEFMAQYQQAPYPGESPSEFFSGMYYKLPTKDVPDQQLRLCYGRVKESAFVEERVFGFEIGIKLYQTPTDLDAWERETVVQQANLVASSRRETSREEQMARVEALRIAAQPSEVQSATWKPGPNFKPAAKPDWVRS